jgi:hypothetical protein
MFGVGVVELLIMLLMAVFTIGIPVATLVFVILIYRNTRR